MRKKEGKREDVKEGRKKEKMRKKGGRKEEMREGRNKEEIRKEEEKMGKREDKKKKELGACFDCGKENRRRGTKKAIQEEERLDGALGKK